MLADFHVAVYDFINRANLAPVYDVIPDDANELPCIVVGRPLAVQTPTAVVFDMAVEIFVLGRRQHAGGSQAELMGLADQLWLLFNGTRGTTNQGHTLAVRGVFPQEQTIAGQGYPAYLLTVESSIATC